MVLEGVNNLYCCCISNERFIRNFVSFNYDLLSIQDLKEINDGHKEGLVVTTGIITNI